MTSLEAPSIAIVDAPAHAIEVYPPYAGVAAADCFDGVDEADDLEPPHEELVLGYIPASRVQLTIWQQCVRSPFFLLFSMFVMCFALNFTTRRMPDPGTQLQLPDWGFELTPELRSLEHGTDLMLWGMNALDGATHFLLWRISTGKMDPAIHPAKFGFGPRRKLFAMSWIRYWFTFGFATLLRSVTITLTVLPSPNNECKTRPTIDNIWYNTVIGVATFGAKNVHCGDLLFSGHTVAIMSNFMAVWTYGPVCSAFLRPAAVAFTLFSFFCMLCSRSHYSDDIIVAVYVCATLYNGIGHNIRRGAPYWAQIWINPLAVFSCGETPSQSEA